VIGVASLFQSPGLNRLWDSVAQRLQRNGLSVSGVISLDDLSRDERHALAGLTGRPVTGSRIRLRLDDLDRRLREAGAGGGLVAVIERTHGPLVDRKGLREARAASRARVWSAARSELDAHGLSGASWAEPWLESARPIVNRLAPDRAETVVVTAVRGLARLGLESTGPAGVELAGRGMASVGRTEFASTLGGSSHALDDGSVLGTLILRGVTVSLGEPPPVTAADRRRLWELAGVQSDEVSTTVLTLGLRPPGDSALAGAVRARSDAGAETHLTLRDLRRIDAFVSAGTPVWVCENPRVLEAAMDAGVTAVMVCTMGNPTLVVTLLLERLAGQEAVLHYRGDFDWAGVTIANRIISSSGARSWRMEAGDYEAALASAGALVAELPLLDGLAIEAVWDQSLTEAMVRHGRAVHEELMLEILVADLR
jgi:uncharacterized protein (TIGR02679 family)